MNKTEIQSRIEKCESEIASLKADFAKCDCADKAQADGIEQEKCWRIGFNEDLDAVSLYSFRKSDIKQNSPMKYMPECRQVTADDVRGVWKGFDGTMSHDEFAKRAHKIGFRMKVTP